MDLAIIIDWRTLSPFILIRQMSIHLTWRILIRQTSNLIMANMINRRYGFSLPRAKFKSHHDEIIKRYIFWRSRFLIIL